MGWRSFTSEQIDAKRIPRCCRTGVDSDVRNANRGVPDVCRRIDPCLHLKSRVPGPAFFVMRFVQVDIKVHPLSLRRYFEFPVTLDIFEVGTNEHLGYVPIP